MGSFPLLALGTLLFLCSQHARSAAFSGSAIVLVNLEAKCSRAASPGTNPGGYQPSSEGAASQPALGERLRSDELQLAGGRISSVTAFLRLLLFLSLAERIEVVQKNYTFELDLLVNFN